MKAADQWEFITGAANTEVKDYKSKKQKVCSSVLQCVGQKFMPMVMSCQTAKDVGYIVPVLRTEDSELQGLHTIELYGLCMKRSTRIQEHLCQLDELSDNLVAIGEAVSKIHKVAVLLGIAQDSYSTLVTTLLA